MALLLIAALSLSGWLMATRRMAATLALPITACAVAIIALCFSGSKTGWDPAWRTFFAEVIDGGVSRLAPAIFAVVLGAVLAAQMKLSGSAERIVRYAAEYAGDNRFKLALLLLAVVSLLFTTLGGLGAVILVASVTLPLLFSLGFEPKVAAAILLFGLSLGGCLNAANWAAYTSMLNIPASDIVPYASCVAFAFFIVAIAYLLVALRPNTSKPVLFAVVPGVLLILGSLGFIAAARPTVWHLMKLALFWFTAAFLASLVLLLVLRLLSLALKSSPEWERPDNWAAACAPLFPLVILIWSSINVNLKGPESFQIPFISALVLGITYAALASAPRHGSSQLLMRSLHEALPSAGPAVMLLIGIGMLLKATALPEVTAAVAPLISKLPLASPASFVAVFFLLSPLALYRGPLNLYGMGSGLAGIMAGSGVLAGPLIMVALFSVGMLQGVCDPTNTHNVWVANFCRVSTAEILRHTMPWVLAVVLLGLCAGAWLFLPAFG